MAAIPAHLKGLSRVERRAYYARTTPTSRQRILAQINASHLPPEQPVYQQGDFFVPEIDQTRRATVRGAEDLLGAGGLDGAPLGGDYGQRLRRLSEDFELGNVNLDRQQSEGLAESARQYGILGDRQQSAQVASGTFDPSTIAASLAARTGNRTREEGSFVDALNRARGELGVNFTRTGEDINTAAQRTRREGNIGLGDLDQTEVAAANAAGYVPPTAARPPRITSYPRRKKRRR